MQNESLFRDKPALIRMIVPCGTGGGDVGEVFQYLPFQNINIHRMGGLLHKGVDILLVVVQGSFTDFLCPLKGYELSGGTL